MLKSYKYRIYPNNSQSKFISKHFGCVRFIYNWALDKKIKLYETEKKSLSYFDLANELTILKQDTQYEWLNEIYSQALQMSLRNLDVAFKRFFRLKTRFPKFKSKKNNHQSYQLPQNVSINFETNKVKIPKLGLIKTKINREFIGKIKTCTISKVPSKKFYISILVDDKQEQIISKPKTQISTTLGIDLGISTFATYSNGIKIKNPKYLKNTLNQLKFQQRKLSKKIIGSNNRNKQRIKVAILHEKVSNQRNDFFDKLTYNLTHENQVESIALETLDIKQMLQNKYLSQSISNVSWSKFISMLEYKCNWYNKNLIFIGQFEPSSKICSHCGTSNKDLKLSDRIWTCNICNTEHDRDINAAKNIKNFALQKQNLIGMSSPKSTLVESNSLEPR